VGRKRGRDERKEEEMQGRKRDIKEGKGKRLNKKMEETEGKE